MELLQTDILHPMTSPKKHFKWKFPGCYTISIVSFTIKVGLTLPLMHECCHGTAGNRYCTPYDLPKKKTSKGGSLDRGLLVLFSLQ